MTKRSYQVKTELGNSRNTCEYTVVARNAAEACKIALRQSVEDNGQKTSGGQPWRVIALTERPERLVM